MMEIMEAPATPHASQWRSFLKSCGNVAAASQPFQLSGSLTRVTGLVMEAVGLKLAVGSGCTVLLPNGNQCRGGGRWVSTANGFT